MAPVTISGGFPPTPEQLAQQKNVLREFSFAGIGHRETLLAEHPWLAREVCCGECGRVLEHVDEVI